MQGLTLFEGKWSNSKGDIDGWTFVLLDNQVVFTYSALFDANTQETIDVSVKWDCREFGKAFIRLQKENKVTIDGSTFTREGEEIGFMISGSQVIIENLGKVSEATFQIIHSMTKI